MDYNTKTILKDPSVGGRFGVSRKTVSLDVVVHEQSASNREIFTRQCSKCHTQKTASEFYKDKRGLHGLRPDCKICHNNQIRGYRQTPKGKTIRNRISRAYYLKRKTMRKEYLNHYQRTYQRNRLTIDPQYKLARTLRRRLYKALKHNEKNGSAVRDLGCTIKELRVYIEQQFQPGMTWANWAFDGWHIDHRRALSLFDLTKREEILEACHFTNLQPMWQFENLSKGKRPN
ncbi:MAG: hypothetical protein NUV96_02170 [Candidatus Colwellbacteria bacterium]|nr:hypothetical protein [Candidatus Colwellbacteria bacterium]